MEYTLTDLSPHLKKLIKEYAYLASLSQLNEQQEERLSQLLERASQSEVLSFWLAEVDHIVGHTLGLLQPEDQSSYADQKALLRERLMSEYQDWEDKVLSSSRC